MTIKILDNSIINKIAAGEVIERPASVVKELLENSFDSNADEVKIEIVDGGFRKIKISDNGCGMERDDLLISFKRHATSKISSEDDLFNILSLGFRGEALASIAEISNLKIKTKTKESSIGNFVEIEGGELIKEESVSCSDGTIVEVSDLFFNVPARKNYLKGKEVEFSKIVKIVTKHALIRPDVSIKLIHNNKEIINSQKTDSELENILFIYGAEVSNDLVEVDYFQDGIKVRGYISKPNLTRADKEDQSLYVNGRHVKNNIISNAIYEAYKTLLFIHRHPLFILDVNINPKDIDVNVHPAKNEIRLKDEGLVSQIIFNAVQKAFVKGNLIRSVSVESESYSKPSKQYEFSMDRQSVLEVRDNVKSTNEYQLSYPRNEKLEVKQKERKLGDFYIFGQINKTFIIAENKDGLVIIDQHAAEERVNYEKFTRELRNKAIRKQFLLNSKIVELNPMQYLIAKNNKDFFEKIGFVFEDFGENTVKLVAVPEIFGRLKSVLFIDLVNEIGNLKNKIIDEEIEARIVRFACRASVKAGDELSIVQMRKLIDDLAYCDNPFSCPHGRPTIVSFSIGDLEKKFNRSGW
ncbi:MAG: DNA mismatch repair endonuclease MutL [Candidatus Pacearchaeota archaeon]|nr:DNA mismatch repair endonuclease MutL [Candidatus Pacearchaeota archaeon]